MMKKSTALKTLNLTLLRKPQAGDNGSNLIVIDPSRVVALMDDVQVHCLVGPSTEWVKQAVNLDIIRIGTCVYSRRLVEAALALDNVAGIYQWAKDPGTSTPLIIEYNGEDQMQYILIAPWVTEDKEETL
jgi:hypothetical protein